MKKLFRQAQDGISMRRSVILYSLLLALPMAGLLLWLNFYSLASFRQQILDARRSTLEVHVDNADKTLSDI